MNFKVGDKVKVVHIDPEYYQSEKQYLNKTGVVKEVNPDSKYPYKLVFSGSPWEAFQEWQLELAERPQEKELTLEGFKEEFEALIKKYNAEYMLINQDGFFSLHGTVKEDKLPKLPTGIRRKTFPYLSMPKTRGGI